MIVNTNPAFGDRVAFETPAEMAEAIAACGYTLQPDGLLEGRDYEDEAERLDAFDEGGRA